MIVLTRTYGIVHADALPSALPGTPVLEKQTESFTCGVHALGTVYRAYGLDPESERIRWRLGVDTKAVFWKQDTTGALHPDMYMVLTQDYFEIGSLDMSDAASWPSLLDHLESGHLAVLLIARRENGNLHWVVATEAVGERVRVYDSLFEEPYLEDEGFGSEHVVSAMLVRPTADRAQAMSSFAAHREGSSVLLAAGKRIRALVADTDATPGG
ncbi:MAG: hypothetical protein AAF333_09510 [Planctomycetota bacterium]